MWYEEEHTTDAGATYILFIIITQSCTAKVHPHLKCVCTEVDTFWYIRQQLMIETFNPKCISTLINVIMHVLKSINVSDRRILHNGISLCPQ